MRHQPARKTSNKHPYDPKVEVGWFEYSWTAKRTRLDAKREKKGNRGKRTVHVKACVARGRDGKPLVYIAFGLGKWTPEPSGAGVSEAVRDRGEPSATGAVPGEDEQQGGSGCWWE